MSTYHALLIPPDAREYFCKGCGQLRLYPVARNPERCGRCGSSELVIDMVGTLDKAALQADWRKTRKAAP